MRRPTNASHNILRGVQFKRLMKSEMRVMWVV